MVCSKVKFNTTLKMNEEHHISRFCMRNQTISIFLLICVVWPGSTCVKFNIEGSKKKKIDRKRNNFHNLAVLAMQQYQNEFKLKQLNGKGFVTSYLLMQLQDKAAICYSCFSFKFCVLYLLIRVLQQLTIQNVIIVHLSSLLNFLVQPPFS